MLLNVTISVLAEGSVVIPVWVISIVIGLVVSILSTWGILQAAKSNLETRAERSEKDIESLKNEKANRGEFLMVYEMLKDIRNKLDEHISNED